MALLHFDGFEHFNQQTQFLREYQVTAGGGSETTGRVQGFARNLQGTSFETNSFGVKTTLISGFGFMCSFAQTTSGFAYRTGGSEQLRYAVSDNGDGTYEWEAFRGATSLGITAESFLYGVWHYMEFSSTIDTGTSGAIEIRRNEQAVLTLSGINTANNGTTGADTWQWSWTTFVGAPTLDDFYVLDTTGALNNTFAGDTLIVGSTVTANGNQTDWTPNQGMNFQNVDDPTTPSDGTNTNQSDTNTNVDLFVMSDLIGVTGAIAGVKIETQLAMSAAGTRTVRSRVRDTLAVGEATGGSFTVNDTNFSTFTHIFEQNPVTVAAWTTAEIDALEIGYEVVS